MPVLESSMSNNENTWDDACLGYNNHQRGGCVTNRDISIHEAEAIFGFVEGDTYDESTVKEIYRKLIKENHPDAVRFKGVDAAEANKRMSDINKAYAVLKNIVSDGRIATAVDPKTAYEEEVLEHDFADFMRDVANGKYANEYEEDWFERQERERREAQAKAREEYERKKAAENAERDRRAEYARTAPEVGRVYNWCKIPMDTVPEEQAAAQAAYQAYRDADFAKARGLEDALVGGNRYAQDIKKSGRPLIVRAVHAILNCEALWRIAFLLIGLFLFNQSVYGDNAFFADNQLPMLLILMLSIVNLIFGFVTKPIRRACVWLLEKACGER